MPSAAYSPSRQWGKRQSDRQPPIAIPSIGNLRSSVVNAATPRFDVSGGAFTAALQHRLHQPAKRLGGERIGEREALQLVEVRLGNVGMRIAAIDPGGDVGQRRRSRARATQGGLLRFDFRQIHHAAQLYISYNFGTVADRTVIE